MHVWRGSSLRGPPPIGECRIGGIKKESCWTISLSVKDIAARLRHGRHVLHVLAGLSLLLIGPAVGSAAASRASIVLTTMSPSNGSTVSSTVSWQVSASGGTPSRVDFAVDGSLVWSQTRAPYSGMLDTTKLSNGQHTLTATAQTNQGNGGGNSASTRLTITVSNATSAATDTTTSAVTTSSSAVSPLAAPSGFVSRSGQQLFLNGAPYRFVGFNVWRAAVASWNQPPNTSYDLNDGNALDQTLKDMNANGGAGGGSKNVIRVWFYQQFALQNGAYNWSAFDKVLQVAAANGFKVIATLQDQWDYEGTGFKDYTWYQSGYANAVLSPHEVKPYRQYVQDVVSRYKDNPTILAWELVNEPEVAVTDGVCVSNSEPIMASFVHDVGGLIKSIDPNHLVSLGASGNGMCGTIESEYQSVMSDPSIDLCSFHDYYGAANTTAYNQYNGLNVRISQCASLNKPVYIGEAGIHLNTSPVNGSLSTRASYFSQKMSAQSGMQGVVGYLPWQFDDRGYITDDYVIGPGDPVLPMMDGYASP